MPDFDERLAHALRTIVRRARRDTSFAEAARGARLARADRELVISFVENFHAATADAIGARWIARGGAEGPGRSMRFAVGHASLVDALAGELSGSLRLGCRATRITWSRGSVRVVVSGATGHDFELAARAAIVALPLGVLRSPEEALCHVHFDPHLDAAHTDALAKLAMGDVVKVVLRFREAFWSEHGGENVAFFHSVRGPFPTFWTSAPIDSPVITAWAGGRLAQALSGIDERRLSALAVDSLADVVGQRRRHAHELFETSFFHDWRLDPFARGAYSHGLVGGATADRPAARPIEGTLFFAGEHLAGASSAGTVEGAIESGERAAREVLASHSSASSRRKAA
jgi:monoamine oxidase